MWVTPKYSWQSPHHPPWLCLASRTPPPAQDIFLKLLFLIIVWAVHGIIGLLRLLLKLCQADECEDFKYGLMNTKMRRTLHLAQKFGHWTTAGDNGAVRTIVKIWNIYWILSKSRHKTKHRNNNPHTTTPSTHTKGIGID